MAFRTLLVQDLAATGRGRFGLLGAVAMLLMGAALAAAIGPERREAFLLPVFGLGPLILLPLATAQLVHARSTRFLHVVFTSPVRPSEYILARFCVTLLLGLAYVAAMTALLVVAWAHLGVRAEEARFVALGVGMAVYAASMGTLIGVLFTSRGTLAGVAASTAVMVASAAGLLLVDVVARMPPGGGRVALLSLLHATGGVPLRNGLGIEVAVRSTSTLLPALGYVVLAGGALAVAVLAFARMQSVEGWENRGAGRAALGVGVLVIFLLPMALASHAYAPAAPGPAPHDQSSSGVRVRIVPSGAQPGVFTPYAPDVIEAGVVNQVDLLVFVFPFPDAPQPYRDVAIRLDGADLAVSPGVASLAIAENLPAVNPDGRPAEAWPYVRVPVALTPDPPRNLKGNEHLLVVNVSFVAEGGKRVEGEARVLVLSEVAAAPAQMLAVGLPVPVAMAAAYGARRWRMR